MKVGVTGSSRQVLMSQLAELAGTLGELQKEGAIELHHGDCIHADDYAAKIARMGGYRIIGHPPDNDAKRAHFPSDEEREPLPYLNRNQAIVDEVDVLIAVPDGPKRLRSGTWSTVRRARKAGIRVIEILPEPTS